VFERFTRAARMVVTSAVDVARDRGDSRVDTEHLLAGVSASSSRAADLLNRLGAGPEQVKAAISDLDRTALAAIGIDQDSVRLGPHANEWLRTKRHIPFNGAAKGVLQGALREAMNLRHRNIGSGHILAALTSMGPEDPARRILVGLGINTAVLRREVLSQG
jgi:ATP-dependent Clp protease ATP-binding subunit ClpA